MAIAPLAAPAPPAVDNSFDFSPLAKLAQINQQRDQQNDMLATLANRYGATPSQTSPSTPAWPTGPVPGDAYGNAISGIESGGRYDLLGPLTKTGDRAYGKYQVMGNNIPQWTKDALGTSLTPEQFLADKDAQEKTFTHQFGQYVQKYGPSGAAAAWFAGPGGMNNPNASDLYGTTVADYKRRFNAGLGGQ